MANARRHLFFSVGLATLASLTAAIYSLAYLFDRGFPGWGQPGSFATVYVEWQYSPEAPEVFFGISLTLFLIFLCILISLSRLPTRVKALSVAGVILLVLNAFYIWTTGILYPQTNGLQNYITNPIFIFVQVVAGSWTEYGWRFLDFGLPALALGVGACGAALRRKRVDRVIGFFLWTSIAVFPLGLECHLKGLGSDTVISYFMLSKSPLNLITNDLILYLSGFILVLCLCVTISMSMRFGHR
jgi:hypothetical protein